MPAKVRLVIKDSGGWLVDTQATYRSGTDGRIELGTLESGRWNVTAYAGDSRSAALELKVTGDLSRRTVEVGRVTEDGDEVGPQVLGKTIDWSDRHRIVLFESRYEE